MYEINAVIYDVRHTGEKKTLEEKDILKKVKERKKRRFLYWRTVLSRFSSRSIYFTGRLGTKRLLWPGPQNR